MDFPVDMLEVTTHGELERSAQTYMDKLLYADPERPHHFTLANGESVPVCLSNVGFVPLYGASVQHKVLALFTPQDQFTAVALFLADHWCSLEEILRTTNPTRQGLIKVRSVGERIVLYVLNRIVYRSKEMAEGELPFLCHCENHFAKILWKDGEAVGFYSVKTKGSACSNSLSQRYFLPVMDSIFVKKAHRGKCHGLQMLEDFVDSFNEAELGLKFPLSPAMANVCKHYLQRYPADVDLLWEVEGVGGPYQRTRVASRLASRAIERASVSTRTQSSEHRTSKRARDEELMVEVQPEKIRRIKGDDDFKEESGSSDGTAEALEVAGQKDMSEGAEEENESLVRIVSVGKEEDMQVEESAALHVVKDGGDTADRTAENIKHTVSDGQDEENVPAAEDEQNVYRIAAVQRTHEGSNEEEDDDEAKPINETGSVAEEVQEMHPTVTKDEKKTPTKEKKVTLVSDENEEIFTAEKQRKECSTVVEEKNLSSASVEYKEDSPAAEEETKDSPAVEEETRGSKNEEETELSPKTEVEKMKTPEAQKENEKSPKDTEENKTCPPAEEEALLNSTPAKEEAQQPDVDLIKELIDVEMFNVPEQLPEDMVQVSVTEDSIRLQMEEMEEEKAALNEASWTPGSLGTRTNLVVPSTPTHTSKMLSTRTLVKEEEEQEAAMDHEKEWSGSNEIMEADHSLVEEEDEDDEEGDDPPVVDRRVLRRTIKVIQGAARPRTKRRGRM